MSYYSAGGGASFLGSSFLVYFFGSYFLVSSLAATGALVAASTSLILYLNYQRKYPDSIDNAAMFLKALPMMRGTVAAMGIPAESESPTMFLAPVWNLVRRALGSRLTMASGRMCP